MKFFKTIDKLIDSFEIIDKSQYRFDLIDNKFIIEPCDERVHFYIELNYLTKANGTISVSNSKLNEFKEQLELAEIIIALLNFASDNSSIYEIWVLNDNSFSIRFKPEIRGKTKISSQVLVVQFDGDNMIIVFNNASKTFNIVNLTVREIYDKIIAFKNSEILKQVLNHD